MSTDPRTLLPTGSTALERAVDLAAPRWQGLVAAVRPLAGGHPEPFKPWLAAEWALADFARYFADIDQLLAAGLPWLFERGTAAGVKRALAWIGFAQARIDEDGPWLHIDLGRAATDAELARIVHLVRATVPAHVHFYRVYWAWDLRPIWLDARPPLDAGILDNESGIIVELDGQDPIKASFGERHAEIVPRPATAGIQLHIVARLGQRAQRIDTGLLDAWSLDSVLSLVAIEATTTHHPAMVPAHGLGAGQLSSMPAVYMQLPAPPPRAHLSAGTGVLSSAAERPLPYPRSWTGGWDADPWAASPILTQVTTET